MAEGEKKGRVLVGLLGRITMKKMFTASAPPPQARLLYTAQNTETQQAAHLWLLFAAVCQTQALRVAAFLLRPCRRLFHWARPSDLRRPRPCDLCQRRSSSITTHHSFLHCQSAGSRHCVHESATLLLLVAFVHFRTSTR